MLLLDTCTLLWLTTDPTRLSVRAKTSIAQSVGNLWVSAISAFEVGQKYRARRLLLAVEPEEWWPKALQNHGLQTVDVTGEIALASTRLPAIHRDPCDRLIIATAQIHNAAVVTSDPIFSQYPGITIVW